MRPISRKLYMAMALALPVTATVNATEWVTPIHGGEIRFDDWGYVGPNGRTAMDFSAVNGFGGPAEGNALDQAGGIGQMQHVVTKDPDGLTPDPTYNFSQEFTTNNVLYPDASTDAQVNFFDWGYTTVGGSTFDNMRIDYDGDYMIDRSDMNFQIYETFMYTDEGENATPADGTYGVNISFKPYALSDATGWCGSILASNPASLEAMAGQIQFDFGFEVYFYKSSGFQVPGEGNMQIISGFQMRSYGSIMLEITQANGAIADLTYYGNAVVNNTNPTGSNVNPDTDLKEVGGGDGVDGDWYNQVSFMGAGIIPVGVWVLVEESAGIIYRASNDLAIRNDQILRVAAGVAEEVPTEEIPAGTVWMYHLNSFGNYTFLMRADGIRVIEAVDYAKYPVLTNVPTVIPDAVSLADVAYNEDENAISNPIADITGTLNAFSFTDQSATMLPTNNDPYTLNGETPVDITTDYIDAATIVVTNLTDTQTYVEDTDYTIIAVGSQTSIERLITGAITDGQDVLIDYSYQSGVTPDTLMASNTVTLTGLDRETVITISGGGEYSVNAGPFTSERGVVVNNDTVQVQITSSVDAETAVNAVLTVGSLSDTFSATTSVNVTDTDGDGVIDTLDNCNSVANADQRDTDNDHYGNACDADFNNDGIANVLDTGLFKNAFFTVGNIETDLNSDGIVNSLDLGKYKQQFLLVPGPSGLI